MIHQYKVELQQRERITTFQDSVKENNKKFLENNMKKSLKKIVINTKLFKSCYVIQQHYILINYFYNLIG